MAIKSDREYRSVMMMATPVDDENNNYIVEGYATTWDDPYEMYEFDGVKYYEKISRGCLSNANTDDIIFLYNHEGRVFARQKNGTLQVSEDNHGLKIRADLSSTTASREMYEDIKSGLITEMSWSFTVDPNYDTYDKRSHTRTIGKVKKVYDVSAVSIPANPGTEISARNYYSGVAEMEQLEKLQRERDKKVLELKLKLEV